MYGLDIATGQKHISHRNLYKTTGPATVRNVTDVLPPLPEPECYVLAMGSTCTENQMAALEAGSAVVKDFVVEEPKPSLG